MNRSDFILPTLLTSICVIAIVTLLLAGRHIVDKVDARLEPKPTAVAMVTATVGLQHQACAYIEGTQVACTR